VKFVAEFDIPSILQLEVDFFDGMTFCAIVCFKGVFAVMTGAAGPSFLHQGHGDRLSDRQIEYLGMADLTSTGTEVFLMTERHGSRFLDFHADVRDLMTLGAILQVGGPLAVVARSAGLAFFHIGHGVTGLAPQIEYGIMAGLAVIFDAFLFEVLVVVEYDLAEVGDPECDILDIDGISERTNEDRDDR
jgi:hypothetical protein